MSRVANRGPSIRDLPPEFPAGELPKVDATRLQAFCLFIGYPRSGHTLIGSLLDAHPDIVIANELDVLKYVRPAVSPEVSRDLIFSMLLESSRQYAEGGCRMRGYAYQVPGQWQGRYQEIKVIGDKRGGVTSRRLAKEPDLLQRIRDRVQLPLKLIHVYRNPFDNIATMSRREALTVVAAVNMYFELAADVMKARSLAGAEDILDLSHESFIRDPRRRLRELCAFLGQDAPADYLDACAGIVFESPHPTRDNVAWKQREIDAIREHMANYPFLREYLDEPAPELTPARATGGKEGAVEAKWPEGEGPRVLVLLNARHRDFESVLQALKRLGARVLVQCPRIPKGLLKKFQSDTIHFSERLIELTSAFRECELVINPADLPPVAAALSAGVPQLLLPGNPRQKNIARRVSALGAGEMVILDIYDMPPHYEELIPSMLKDSARYREAARAYMSQFKTTDAAAQGKAVQAQLDRPEK